MIEYFCVCERNGISGEWYPLEFTVSYRAGLSRRLAMQSCAWEWKEFLKRGFRVKKIRVEVLD